ncbi:MAG: radical SAM protein [Pseudomonadota bacterium]
MYESVVGTDLFSKAWEYSRTRHGNVLTAHVPGMFVVDGRRGRYRAVSITGSECALDCEHCKGGLLRTMAPVQSPELLFEAGLESYRRGDYGILISGGCDSHGQLPWKDFIPAIERLKVETGLIVTVHPGQINVSTARDLKAAGVDQALVDVIGDDDTAEKVYHLKDGVGTIRRTLDALTEADLEMVPHILFGMHYGRQRGERTAIEILKQYPLKKYVVVVLTPTRGTPMENVVPPAPACVAEFLILARLELPDIQASLGCARPRGRYRRELDVLAVRAGVNSIALPADQALAEAEQRGLAVLHRETCCSLGDRAGRARSGK